MRIFIIGASGLVGSNCLHCMQKDPLLEVVGTHYSFATIDTEYFNDFDPGSATFDLAAFNPEVIIHAAALTHVDRCETHPEESYHHTVGSAAAVLELAKHFGSKLIYISSDYIFDGQKGPYVETDKPNPLNVYGRHKLEAEKMIIKNHPDHLILRITNVYGDEIRGKNFVSFLIRTAKDKKERTLRLPSDQYATPVNALDVGQIACRLIRDDRRGIFHLASDEYFSRVELAQKVLSYFPRSKCRIEPVLTKDLGQAAPRPLRGGLKTDKIRQMYPDYRFGTVDDYMEKQHGL